MSDDDSDTPNPSAKAVRSVFSEASRRSEFATHIDVPAGTNGAAPQSELLDDATPAEHNADTSGSVANHRIGTKSRAKRPSPHAGHRQRLRERVLSGGLPSMADYELLEMILFGAIARGDTKPLAKRLLAHFGSLSEVIHAPEARLLEVNGVGNAVISELKLVREAALRLLRTEVRDQPVLSSWQQVVDYCQAAMSREAIEQFRVLFLDKKNRLITDETLSHGTVDHTPVYIREILKRALEVSSTAIILVHNHPSGDPTPSRADVDMTQQIMSAAKPLGVHDHIIVSRGGHASFRNLGLIR